jgi:hypothetical protein
MQNVFCSTTLINYRPPPGTAKIPSTAAFALLWTFALFHWPMRRLEGGLAWRPTRFPSLRTAKRTTLERTAFCVGTLRSALFLLPPRRASLGNLPTGPVDPPNMTPLLPPCPSERPRVPSCFKDLCFLRFRLNKTNH